jgi:iron complex outermembrane receptor protein
VRGSYSESFRAPVLKQLYGAQEEGAITITSASQCALLGQPVPCTINAYQVNGANPNLKAEKAKTYNLGLIFEPSANFSTSIDYWRLQKKDDISAPTITTALEQGRFELRGPRYYIFTNLTNIAERLNKGVDLDARVRVPGTAIGSLSFRNMTTYYISQKRQDSAAEPLKEYVNTYATPRWRNNFSVTSDMGPWAVTGVLRTVGGFYDSDEDLSVARTFNKVAAHEEVDLQTQYSGFKGLTLTGGIKNVLDKMPPFSAQNASDNTYTQMGFAELYNVRGRFYYVKLNYKFN